jgi:hypothetical protein
MRKKAVVIAGVFLSMVAIGCASEPGQEEDEDATDEPVASVESGVVAMSCGARVRVCINHRSGYAKRCCGIGIQRQFGTWCKNLYSLGNTYCSDNPG